MTMGQIAFTLSAFQTGATAQAHRTEFIEGVLADIGL